MQVKCYRFGLTVFSMIQLRDIISQRDVILVLPIKKKKQLVYHQF